MTTILKIVASFQTTLANKITSSATSMTLVTGTDDAGTTLSGVFGFVIDEGTASEEFVIGTVAGTAVTGMTRGLDPQNPSTEVTALKKEHRRGATVKITDYPVLGRMYRLLTGDDTFPNLLKYATALTPTDPKELVPKAYVDSVVGGIATTINVVVPGIAGETIAAGNLVYWDSGDAQWLKCDADTAATVENVVLGIAQGAGTDGNLITGGILLRGLDANQVGLTAGLIYYASNTAGGVSSSAGTKEVTVGFAYSTTQLYFNPRFNQQLTEDQQDALEPTTALSSTNKVMSQKDFQKGLETYAADSVGTDSYAITLSPAIAAYANGMVFRFKAGTANTGGATLAVNGLAAKAIVKNFNAALATGDILAGQIVEVQYESVGDNFQMLSPVAVAPLFKIGTTTKNLGDASTTQAIAHGLGATPKYVRITVIIPGAASTFKQSIAVYNGTIQSSISAWGPNNAVLTTDTNFRVGSNDNTAGAYQEGVVTFDGTNISIAWTKTSTPAGTAQILWEAFA